MLEGKTKQSKFQLRVALVRYAQKEGIREAARAFVCSRNTVRLWLRRYGAEGLSGLKERSRAPKRIPHKTSPYHEGKVIEARLKVPGYGAKRLKEMFALKPSIGATARILRQNGLTRKLKKKYQKKRDLREVKARHKALTHHQADTKHLYDIPNYWPQMKALGLPRIQYTIRDTKSGALMLAYAQECSVKYAEMAAERYLEHLKRHGVEPVDVTFQTDGGTEFSGGPRKHRADRGFTYKVEDVWKAKHDFIPPGCSNANADVESSHALIENELYDLERFTGIEDFLTKAAIYQHYFNFARKNSYKGDKTPWQIIEADRPGLSPEVLLLPPIMLDETLRQPYRLEPGVGQYVPVDPVSYQLLWQWALSSLFCKFS